MTVAIAAPIALDDAPLLSRPDLSTEWAKLAGNLAEFGQLRERILRRFVMPRALEIGRQLDALQRQYRRGLQWQEGEGFLADAYALTGLRKSQIGAYLQVTRKEPVLRLYLERHEIPDPQSLAEARKHLAAATAEAKESVPAPDRQQPAQLGDATNATDEGLVSVAVNADPGDADADPGHHRQEAAANAELLRSVVRPLWKLSASPALQHRKNLAEQLGQLAEVAEVLVTRVHRALEDSERLHPEQIEQAELELVAVPVMPVVISCPEQIDEAQTEVIATSAHLTAEDPAADAVIPGDTAAIAAKAAAKGETKKIGVVAERYPDCRESLARLQYDIDQAGGHQFLADLLGCKRSAVSMRLKMLRDRYS